MAGQGERSDTMDKVMLLCVLAPVTGAMFAGPVVGLTLVTLGLTDSILLIVGRFL